MPLTDASNLDQLQNELAQAVAAAETGQEQAPTSVVIDESAPKAPAPKEPQPKPDDVILDGEHVPEKFRGKRVSEVLSSYQNLESAYGRLGNEHGQLRSLTDQFLVEQLTKGSAASQPEPVQEQPAQIDLNEFLADPTAALNKYLQATQAKSTTETATRVNNLEQTIQQQQFFAKHPDYQDVAQSADFVEWANRTPYRLQLAQQAQKGSFDAADALLTEFKDARPKPQPQPNNESLTAEALEAARRVTLEGSSNGGNSSNSGRTYSRASLMQLRQDRPDVYGDPVFQAEILKAYAEGRVK